ncbi:MAG TPA: hypothetical protein RMH99_01555 [Sandaracinaceae bacterium LLY-WYZ-13_1]|nr:hypothetical protein [Sandaracinaceae bacterium LLY-WYZ-13_1]
MPSRSSLLCLSVLLFSLSGCDCDGPVEGCATDGDCASGQACVDGECRPREDAGTPTDASSGTDGGPPDAGDRCESMLLCGTPAVCCDLGDECIAGACLPACESGVRCGADRATCCDAGQVCVSDACVDPGDECTDSFDCPMGAFCEPTLGRCLPQFDPVTCETTPVFGDFEPVVEWSATTATDVPTCMHGISAPVVVDLTGDGAPEVVASFACDSDWTEGVLRAFDGDGTPRWTVDAADLRLNGRTSIAGGDLDADGRAEIVAVLEPSDSRVIAIDDDGSLLWRSTAADGTTPYAVGLSNGAPTLADLDQDGSPEIVLGAVVLDAGGRLVWERDGGPAEGTNDGYTGGIAAVADIDLDGEPEVVTGHRAYEANGDERWSTMSIPDGYPAIAQFDADAPPEVVLVASGNLYLLDGMTGAVEWGPIAQPGGGRGGPPTVADFDGDGAPEIGVAGAGSYSVYDPAETDPVLWSRTTQDLSSNATGSSVFDFEGDGAAEVVYGDECYMRVYRGSDGEVLLQIPSSSATIHEYPLVADVDADGNSEIVIVANDRVSSIPDTCRAADSAWDGNRQGLFVYGDTRDQWVRTRRIWNQHAYHVTNVTAAGEIPRVEMDNWSTPGLNNYRQNVQGEGVFNAPDLKVLALEVILDGCPETATLRARITNEGNLGAPSGVPVSFYTGTPSMRGTLLGTEPTAVALLPGETTVVELADVALEGDPPYAFVAVVDDDGSDAGVVAECDEDDNAEGIGDLDCDVIF